MAIMKKMLFIINPRSGKEQIRSRLLEILDSFEKAGYGPSVYITQGPKDAEYQAARAKTKELVVCSGGDGTLNEVVSGLMMITPEKRPELGYIPSGSTNDFASSLGLPKNMRKAAQTAALGKPFLVDVGVFGKTGISSMWRRSEHLRRYPIRPRRRRKIFWGIRHICWKPSNA